MSYDTRVRFFIKTIAQYNHLGNNLVPYTNKAIRLLLDEMSKEKGFQRHDGQDYFIHPIAVTQTLIDFNKVNFDTKENAYETDVLLTTALLHDILEDVEWIDKDFLVKEFDDYVYQNIDNLSTRKEEDIQDYIDRVSSERISALVKIADRLNNITTLSNSQSTHRKQQVKETRKYYLPLTKKYRYLYFEDASFFWQARTIMNAMLLEVEQSLEIKRELEIEKENNRYLQRKTNQKGVW